MKTKAKALLLSLCAVLLVVATVFATVAFLTSKAEVTNTFTVGNVTITLDEAKVNEYGEKVQGAERVKENKYKLIPGHTYTKDPTIHVKANSEDCYLFVKIENGLGRDGTITGLDTNGWKAVKGHAGVYCYYGSATATARKIIERNETDVQDIKVFDSFTFDDEANPAGYAGKEIKITAYAIQADVLAKKSDVELWNLLNPSSGHDA